MTNRNKGDESKPDAGFACLPKKNVPCVCVCACVCVLLAASLVG